MGRLYKINPPCPKCHEEHNWWHIQLTDEEQAKMDAYVAASEENHPWSYFWASRELLLHESLSVVAAVTYLKWKPGYGNSTKSDTGIRILLQRSVKYPCDKIKELMRCIWISRHWESCVKQKIRTVGNTWIGGYRIWISPGLSWFINPTAGMRSIRCISLRVRQAIARANTCIQPTEVSGWKMVH